MIKGLISLYLPSYAQTIIYMLQSTEYQPRTYLEWYWRTQNFKTVAKRRELDRTRRANLLLRAMQVGILLEILFGLGLIYLGVFQNLVGGVAFGLAVIFAYPVVWAHLIVLPLFLGKELVAKPNEQKAIALSQKIFADHPGKRIAVAGSYGKTTMKELLNTVLSEGLKVAATPANKNVAVSHAVFAEGLSGDEDILIIEYGEGAPGDVEAFAKTTQPTHAIITGLAPAHLDQYKTLQAAGQDIFSVADYLHGNNVYVNADSPESKTFLKKSYKLFDGKGALGWKVVDVEVTLAGTNFGLKKGKTSLNLRSRLVGRHQVGFLAFVAAFGLEMGLSKDQVMAGIAKTEPFEHRMQPYELNGAQIVDDTYNGNLEGIRAGTGLLSELEAKRKIYVTPGLVDQGEESERVHKEVGKLIAGANPNLAVLMKNSATKYIEAGLKTAKYKGELRIEDNPLEFYTNLPHFVANGDLVVMQNDWTDNYV